VLWQGGLALGRHGRFLHGSLQGDLFELLTYSDFALLLQGAGMSVLALPAYAQLSDADEAALSDLYRRGTPPNTLRTWERDLAYIAAWKMASFGRPLDWPEDEKVALRFILDHAQDLTEKPGPAQDVAMELIAVGLRRELTCPSPATLDRRIASWQAF